MVTNDLDQQASQLQALKLQAQMQAINRFESKLNEIEEIRREIELVRQGLLPLIKLDTSPTRVQQRKEREHAPEHEAIERIKEYRTRNQCAYCQRQTIHQYFSTQKGTHYGIG